MDGNLHARDGHTVMAGSIATMAPTGRLFDRTSDHRAISAAVAAVSARSRRGLRQHPRSGDWRAWRPIQRSGSGWNLLDPADSQPCSAALRAPIRVWDGHDKSRCSNVFKHGSAFHPAITSAIFVALRRGRPMLASAGRRAERLHGLTSSTNGRTHGVPPHRSERSAMRKPLFAGIDRVDVPILLRRLPRLPGLSPDQHGTCTW